PLREKGEEHFLLKCQSVAECDTDVTARIRRVAVGFWNGVALLRFDEVGDAEGEIVDNTGRAPVAQRDGNVHPRTLESRVRPSRCVAARGGRGVLGEYVRGRRGSLASASVHPAYALSS